MLATCAVWALMVFGVFSIIMDPLDEMAMLPSRQYIADVSARPLRYPILEGGSWNVVLVGITFDLAIGDW
jgi:hypothetical protein